MKSNIGDIPRFAFKTRDGLLDTAEVLDALGEPDPPPIIMRPLKPFPPLINGMRCEFCEYRKYERTNETVNGLRLYIEVSK